MDVTTKKIKLEKIIFPLHFAIISNDLKKVIELVEEGADINEYGNFRDTPLTHSIQLERDKITEYLLRKGADVNKRNKNSHSPLYFALQNDKTSIMKQLILRGADVYEKDNVGMTALHHFTIINDLDGVKTVVSTCEGLNETDSYGKTPLMLANEKGFTIVEKAIKDGIKKCNNEKIKRTLAVMSARILDEESPFYQEVLHLEIFNHILEFAGLPTAKRYDKMNL